MLKVVDRKYSHEDFLQNPGKYQLFRTARIADSIPDIENLATLSVGQVVGIRYVETRKNLSCGDIEMPVYEVWTSRDKVNDPKSIVYACALGEFVL